MNVRTLMLAAFCAVSLSACACPHAPDYSGAPYGNVDDGTAGTGVGDNGCFRRIFTD